MIDYQEIQDCLFVCCLLHQLLLMQNDGQGKHCGLVWTGAGKAHWWPLELQPAKGVVHHDSSSLHMMNITLMFIATLQSLLTPTPNTYLGLSGFFAPGAVQNSWRGVESAGSYGKGHLKFDASVVVDTKWSQLMLIIHLTIVYYLWHYVLMIISVIMLYHSLMCAYNMSWLIG